MQALVINGPNINLLGIREPELYGNKDYSDLVELCQQAGAEAGFSAVSCFQTNHEGEIVDAIQEARFSFDGIIINPAAYTHTSIAILDALQAVNLPAVEVHISDVDARESFRQISYTGKACFARVAGEGIQGYARALQLLAVHLKTSHER
ncbi:type II 3-dehydroquinate dehydratase [Collinsella sp. AGMB00827]|uniref:3-dehydroquinate dehydratase n=1 Tax=Collinsella ureilytica TaxID=2869515 RepID=A0ABS7MLZ9_9ACTN|nr:type II 3-dehydroquinate dehydratase [Collinsella urealyticum]MBY4798083.1 type II 3-dehydroquinate dehydratase [Collinsella urealyticum]